jgi:hypothetical protein
MEKKIENFHPSLETKKIGKNGNFHFILQFWKSKLMEYWEILLNS